MADLFMGIDPGSNGGVAVLDASSKVVHLDKLPKDDGGCLEQLLRFAGRSDDEHSVRCHLEQIGTAIFGAGKSSSCTLYGNYRMVRMCLTSLLIPFEVVWPKEWQAGLHIPRRSKQETDTSWKGRLKVLAQRMFPRVTVTLATADALLLAEYCRRYHSTLRSSTDQASLPDGFRQRGGRP